VSRLVISWRHRRPTDHDADAVHIVMGVAMAGMLVPRLRVSWTGAGRADVTGCAASFPQAPRERSAGSRRAGQHHGGAEPARQLPGAARACGITAPGRMLRDSHGRDHGLHADHDA